MLSYFLFKRRLKQKLKSLYEVEDPWSSARLADALAPVIRCQMAQLPPAVLHAPLLDAGGGEGHFHAPLRDLITEYHLLDIEKQALDRADKKLQGIPHRLIRKSLDEFRPGRASYGVVWLFSILTYLGPQKYPARVQALLKRLWNALKPGGLMLLIHPYYSPQEREMLAQWGGRLIELGGRYQLNEEQNLARQQFLVQCVRKPE